MTEQEYIDATNLAKVRCALTILREVIPSGGWQTGLLNDVTVPLYGLQDHLFRAAAIDPEQS